MKKIIVALLTVLVLTLCMSSVLCVSAEQTSDATVQTVAENTNEAEDNAVGVKAIAAAVAIGIAALAGAFAMGMSISKATEAISRQPEAEGSIRTTLMLGLVFIETAIIYALIIAILIIFVL